MLLRAKDGQLVKTNQRWQANGLEMLKRLDDAWVPLVFFDPQYRGILDKMRYGNENNRQKARCALEQMDDKIIRHFCCEIDRILKPSGHLMLWMDKFSLITARWRQWVCEFDRLSLEPVDMITWEKNRIGMGYRTRRKSEHLLIFQKLPKRAKGIWVDHGIPDVWKNTPSYELSPHAHAKPSDLTRRLIVAVTALGDYVVDPAAGGYGVMNSCTNTGRNFIGCDLAPCD